ncbi:MAG: aminoacylase [Thalassobius sp.]|nr:aminoacylase [Thalassovita sp.]
MRYLYFFTLALFVFSCTPYDTIITNGKVYDGTGGEMQTVDIGIKNDRIKTVGVIENKKAENIIDAQGKVVSPGFINNLSWAAYPLELDGRSLSDIKQGVTLEIFGEGSSPGPYNPEKVKNTRLSLGQNMDYLVEKGISTNIASFIGATTLRLHQIGSDDRAPTPEELSKMQALVREGMEEGALGIGSSLIYPPAFFASTEELIALCKIASEYNVTYISHMRSEGDKLKDAVEELITIAKEANIDAEIYHLKAAGERNWDKLDEVLEMIEKAQESGLNITANMYNYTGASTGLDACLPPWTQDGGKEKWMARLTDPETKKKIIAEMQQSENEWENFLQLAGDPKNILLLGFDKDSLSYLNGKNLGEVAKARGLSPAETVIDLIVANDGDISTAYFLMSEENVKKQLKLPYITFCSDARSIASEGDNLKYMTHPRTYGNFARLLGKYVREEKVLSMEEAIYKLSGLSAEKLKIAERGKLLEGYFADVVIFDPEKIIDKATFTEPHQYAEGVEYVFVNGTLVLENGKHTGATPGKFVKGPGFKK